MIGDPYRPPITRVSDPDGGDSNLRFLRFYFSLSGRVDRRSYWLYFMLPSIALASALLALSLEGDIDQSVEWGLGIPLLWPAIAVQAKRWHDINRSGWWILINFVPFVGPLVAFVVNGFLRGTSGPNRFGPVPQARRRG